MEGIVNTVVKTIGNDVDISDLGNVVESVSSVAQSTTGKTPVDLIEDVTKTNTVEEVAEPEKNVTFDTASKKKKQNKKKKAKETNADDAPKESKFKSILKKLKKNKSMEAMKKINIDIAPEDRDVLFNSAKGIATVAIKNAVPGASLVVSGGGKSDAELIASSLKGFSSVAMKAAK